MTFHTNVGEAHKSSVLLDGNWKPYTEYKADRPRNPCGQKKFFAGPKNHHTLVSGVTCKLSLLSFYHFLQRGGASWCRGLLSTGLTTSSYYTYYCKLLGLFFNYQAQTMTMTTVYYNEPGQSLGLLFKDGYHSLIMYESNSLGFTTLPS